MTSVTDKKAFITSVATMAFATLLSACSPAPESHEHATTISNMSAQSSAGYSEVVQGKVLQFPRDHLAHNDYKIEWWYLTANLTTSKGEDVGLQCTQFRIGMTPPTEKMTTTGNDWSSNQLYMAHAAITSKD